MRFAWLVVAIFGARYVTMAVAYPPADGDLAWQRWLGRVIASTGRIPHALGSETVTASGAPWVPQEWLFSLGAAVAVPGSGAWYVFAGAAGLAAALALASTAALAVRRGASPRAVALCTICVGVAFFESFGVRAQVAGWACLAAFVLLLDLRPPWCWVALPLAALWSNLHASAVLAPAVAALIAAAAFANEGAGPRTRRAALMAAGSLGAICCNPFGWGLPVYALSLLHNPVKAYISEWKATDLGDPSFAFGALPLLVGLVAFAAAGRPGSRARDTFLALAFAYLMLSAARNIAIFAIVAAPIVAEALTRNLAVFALPAAVRPGRRRRLVAAGLPIATALCAAAVVVTAVEAAPATDPMDPPLAVLAR